MIPPNGAHWNRSFGTNLDSHTHSDAAPARTLLWLLFEFCLADLETCPNSPKQDHGRVVIGVVNVATGCVSVREAHNGAAGPAEDAPHVQSHFHLLDPNKLPRTRQNDSPLVCNRSFLLRYVLWTVSLQVTTEEILKHSGLCPFSCALTRNWMEIGKNFAGGFLWFFVEVR